jgi:tRNA pseudouridine55 synthase
MSRAELPELNGILVVDKPAGVTSHDVVARVRRLLGVKRVGHGGTLDPFATGVLPVAVGRATRLLQYVQNADKRYDVGVTLGAESTTGDTEGELSQPYAGDWPTREALDATLTDFLGRITQTPPAHSAIKVDGQPLYKRARAGEEVAPPPREVRIERIDVTRYAPPELALEVACGKGTYIRALVRDIGRALGVGAYCHALRRAATGPFTLAQAHTLDDLAARVVRAEWATLALPPDAALAGMPAIQLDSAAGNAWYHGRSVSSGTISTAAEGEMVRVYVGADRFAGVGRLSVEGRVEPSFVLPPGRGDWPS